MSDLKALIKELKDTTNLAKTELLGSDPRTRPGHEMARNQAIEKLPALRKAYMDAFGQNVFVLLPTGKNAKTFGELAQQEGGAIVVDSSVFYKSLAARCQQTMGVHQTFGVTQFVTLRTQLHTWCRENNVRMEDLNFANDTITKTSAEVYNKVKELVEKTNGQRLLKTYIEGQVVEQALNQEVDSKVVPVVILNTSEDEQASLIGTLFRGKGLIVETDNVEVKEEFVNKTFKQVQKILKGN